MEKSTKTTQEIIVYDRSGNSISYNPTLRVVNLTTFVKIPDDKDMDSLYEVNALCASAIFEQLSKVFLVKENAE